MPDLTPNLGIKKPTAAEIVTLASFNENYDIIDQQVNTLAQAKADSVTNWVKAQGIGVANTWINLTLQNGWVNYGGTEPNAGYTKIGREVRLRGIIKNGTTTSNVTVFTLPSGYRPATKAYSVTLCSGNGSLRVLINTDGTVNLQGTINNAWVQLEDITFIADGN